MELDAIDGKILYLLGRNSRLSYTAIGRAVQAKREVVAFRIQRLIRNGICKSPATTINPNRLGLINIQTFIRLQGTSLQRIKELEDLLKNDQHSIYAVRLSGVWDYVLTSIFHTSNEISQFVDRLTSEFPEVIDVRVLFIQSEHAPGWKMILDPNKKLPAVPKDRTAFTQAFEKRKPKEKVQIDETDKKILTVLAENARCGIVQIAKNTGISYRTAYERIRQLVLNGVIDIFGLSCELQKAGYTQRMILITLKNIKQNEAKAKQLFDSLPWCSKYWRTFGIAHFRLNVYAKSPIEFANILQTVRTTFGTDLASMDAVENIAMIKSTGFAKWNIEKEDGLKKEIELVA